MTWPGSRGPFRSTVTARTIMILAKIPCEVWWVFGKGCVCVCVRSPFLGVGRLASVMLSMETAISQSHCPSLDSNPPNPIEDPISIRFQSNAERCIARHMGGRVEGSEGLVGGHPSPVNGRCNSRIPMPIFRIQSSSKPYTLPTSHEREGIELWWSSGLASVICQWECDPNPNPNAHL